jgi:hypothetical protein
VSGAPKPAPLVAAIGARQTGKTKWMQQQLRRARPARLLVWDPMEEFAEFGTVFSSRAKLAEHLGARTAFAAVYRPGDALERYPALFDWFCRLAWAAGELHLVVDELADVTAPSRAPAKWSAITRKGRHRGIAATAASQRPASIDKDFLGNCTFIHCGRLNYGGDLDVMARHLGVGADELAGLADLHFVERNMVTGAVRRGVLALAPYVRT